MNTAATALIPAHVLELDRLAVEAFNASRAFFGKHGFNSRELLTKENIAFQALKQAAPTCLNFIPSPHRAIGRFSYIPASA